MLEYAPAAPIRGRSRCRDPTSATVRGDSVPELKVAILGAGNLGTTLAIVLAGGAPGIRAGRSRRVVLWTIEPEVAREIREKRLNTKYLPDVPLARSIGITMDLAEALAGAAVVLVTVPSKVVRDVARPLATALGAGTAGPALPAIVSASKGLEAGTYRRMTEVLASELPAAFGGRVLAMSGPSIAHELSRGTPTAVMLACRDTVLARAVRRDIQTPTLRLQISRDVAGVELGGVLKNAYALAFGLSDGLGLGLNTKAALLARALPELARLGVALGGKRATFYGLAGLGDLVGTGLSEYSRNRRMGEELARRQGAEEALASIPGVVEGIGSVRLARDLAARHDLRLPLLEGIAAAVDQAGDPLKLITRLIG
jgi:glycerol-3-phosphate dehydrogenase (NAD(P)+)